MSATGDFSVQVMECTQLSCLQPLPTMLSIETYHPQVLSEALRRMFGLYLVPASKPEVKTKLEKSGYDSEMGFVVNRSNHWFAIRVIRGTFWLLDSMQKQPTPLSPFTLAETLSYHLGTSGNLFVVRGGSLPDPGTIRQAIAPTGISENLGEWHDEKDLFQLHRGKDGSSPVPIGPGQRLDGHPVGGGVAGLTGEDEGIARAIALSLEEIEREKFPPLLEEPPASCIDVVRVQVSFTFEKRLVGDVKHLPQTAGMSFCFWRFYSLILATRH